MPPPSADTIMEDRVVIKVSVYYPYTPDNRFDFTYYCNEHMPMVKDRLGDACQGIAVDRGISAEAPGSEPLYAAVCHLFFNSVEDFGAAFAPHEKEIMEDIPNYTDIKPVIQISEVLINARRSEHGPFHLHLPDTTA
ncbi:EthD family reductase [Azoarcus sp. KH32C]|uniref:EthD family reductase n=1 Tax=Azoarcus sp. KH32C TaxID=748247 RepID=UPI0018D44285|nr:EthD family reductase [Azoarcus sp. KH32C]